MTKWIRADHAQAEKEAAVAAAYEDAAIRAQSIDHHGWTRTELAAMIRARADTDPLAARDARVRAEARQVKPLEWDRTLLDEWRGTVPESDDLDPLAYELIQYVNPSEEYPSGGYEWNAQTMSDDLFPTLEAAKAAAQADYERRILSALIPDQHKESAND